MSVFTFRSRKTSHNFRPQLETLEERSVPAVLDLTTVGAAGTINGVSFQQADPQPTGCGVINDFLRIQSHDGPVEQGYNSDVRPVQFDEKTSSNFDRSIQVSELPTVNIGGVAYNVILLGINQDQKNPLLSLDELRLYVSDSANVSGYDATTKQLGGLTPVYDMGANWVELNSSLSSGNGSGDMFMFVPATLLTSPTGNPNPYVYLYSKMGVQFGANGGFEQWAPGTGVTLPASASLAGNVYFDANNNGVFDSGDIGLGGVTLTLTGSNFLGQSVTVTATTAPDGSYSFAGLLPGTYSVAETPPGGFQPGTDSVGTVNGLSDGVVAQQYLLSNIQLTAGQSGINYNFGEVLQPGNS